jgi:hypothetical protein
MKTKKISVRSGFTIFQYFFETAKLDFFCGKTKKSQKIVFLLVFFLKKYRNFAVKLTGYSVEEISEMSELSPEEIGTL